MQVHVTFRNMGASRALRERAERRTDRVAHLVRRLVEAHVVLELIRRRHGAEVLLSAGGFAVAGREVPGGLYAPIDAAAQKVERRVERHIDRRSAPRGQSGRRSGTARGGKSARRNAIATPVVPRGAMALEEAERGRRHSDSPCVLFRDRSDGGIRALCKVAGGGLVVLLPEDR